MYDHFQKRHREHPLYKAYKLDKSAEIIPKDAKHSDPKIWACRFCILNDNTSCDTYEGAEQHDWMHLKEGKTKRDVNLYTQIYNLLLHSSTRKDWETIKAGSLRIFQDRRNQELLTLIRDLESSGPERQPSRELARQAANLLLVWPKSFNSEPRAFEDQTIHHYRESAELALRHSEALPEQANQHILGNYRVRSPSLPALHLNDLAYPLPSSYPMPSTLPTLPTSLSKYNYLPTTSVTAGSILSSSNEAGLRPSARFSSHLVGNIPTNDVHPSGIGSPYNPHSQLFTASPSTPLYAQSEGFDPPSSLTTSAVHNRYNPQQANQDFSYHPLFHSPTASANVRDDSQLWSAESLGTWGSPSQAPSFRSGFFDTTIPSYSSPTMNNGPKTFEGAQTLTEIFDDPEINLLTDGSTSPWNHVRT